MALNISLIDAVRRRMLQSSHRKVDISSASTWKDIDDVDLVNIDFFSRKSVLGLLTRSDTNYAVQPQKMARGMKSIGTVLSI